MMLSSAQVFSASPCSFKLLCTGFLLFWSEDFKKSLIWLIFLGIMKSGQYGEQHLKDIVCKVVLGDRSISIWQMTEMCAQCGKDWNKRGK